MRGGGSCAKYLMLGTIIAFSCQFTTSFAEAASTRQQQQQYLDGAQRTSKQAARGRARTGHVQEARSGGISCVPFARSDSGITVSGNAWQWWDNAAGVYARGNRPEAGSVLAFRANGRMQLGHVAVVSRVINPRQVEIEHANWSGAGGMRGSVARNIPVVDVSEANDWSAVRVGLGQSGGYGSVYPTYGFIYDRPDNGVMLATNRAPAPQPELNPAPSDLRPAGERGWQLYEEVAEAPVLGPKRSKRGVHLAASKQVHHASATTASTKTITTSTKVNGSAIKPRRH